MAGVGNGPAQHHAAAHGADARGQGRLEHVAREARVLADDDARGMLDAATRLPRDGGPEAKRDLGGHGPAVRDASDAVGSEERSACSCHGDEALLMGGAGRAHHGSQVTSTPHEEGGE